MNINELFPPPSTTKVNQPKKQLGQEDFMKLLVAQVKNQDPSSPSDNSQFMAQISQMSMVSGIDKLGTSFEGVSQSFYTGQGMQASTLVGHKVLADSNYVSMEEGGGVQGQVQVPDAVQGLNIQVRNTEGALIKTIDTSGFKPGLQGINWDGLNERGEPQPAGDYVVTATALMDGKQQALPLQLYNTVESVKTTPGTNIVELQLAGQRLINLSQVSQYR